MDEAKASPDFVAFTPELRSRFDHLLKASGEARPQVRMPFNYLASSSQVWQLRKGPLYVEAFNPPPSAFEKYVDGAEFSWELRPALRTEEGRQAVRDMILALVDGRPDSDLFTAAADREYPLVQKRRSELLEQLASEFHGTVVRERYWSSREAVVRNRAFAKELLVLYDFKCSLCRSSIRFAGLAEVEAAHIWPVSAGGADDLRNGLALCRTHHWCFDQLLWTVDEGGKVIVAQEASSTDRLGALKKLHGKLLASPSDRRANPHEDVLARHRQAWESAGRDPI